MEALCEARLGAVFECFPIWTVQMLIAHSSKGSNKSPPFLPQIDLCTYTCILNKHGHYSVDFVYSGVVHVSPQLDFTYRSSLNDYDINLWIDM